MSKTVVFEAEKIPFPLNYESKFAVKFFASIYIVLV